MDSEPIEFKRENVTIAEVEKFQNPFCVFMCESRTETSCPFIETGKCDPSPIEEGERR